MAKELPVGLKTEIDALVTRHPDAKTTIDAILQHFQGASLQPASQESLDEALEGATVYENMSMIFPERRKVRFALKPAGFAVVVNDKVTASGSWSEYDLAMTLGLPDKPKPTWNLILTNASGNGPWVVLTLLDQTADKFLAGAKPISIRNVLLAQISELTREVVDDFSLSVPAHLGSKEGTLYFLDSFMFYGFRKPLLLFPLSGIRSISYTVITRQTFNIVIKTSDGVEHELSMITHDEFEGINNYVTRHGLSDESLADERQAKRPKTEEASVLAEAQKEAAQFLDSDEEEGPNFEDGGSDSDGNMRSDDDSREESDEEDEEDEEDQEEEDLDGAEEAEESDS